MANKELRRLLGNKLTFKKVEQVNRDTIWHGRLNAYKSTELIQQSKERIIEGGLEEIELARKVYAERINTVDSTINFLILSGPMSVAEIKAQVRLMRERLLAEKCSEGAGQDTTRLEDL